MNKKEQHQKVQRYFMKVARDIERGRIQAERATRREAAKDAIDQSEKIVGRIEQIFNTRVQVLKEKLDEERYERGVAQQAQNQIVANLSKEIKQERRMEVERFEEMKRKDIKRQYMEG